MFYIPRLLVIVVALPSRLPGCGRPDSLVPFHDCGVQDSGKIGQSLSVLWVVRTSGIAGRMPREVSNGPVDRSGAVVPGDLGRGGR